MIHQKVDIALDCERLGIPSAPCAPLFTYVLENSEEIDPDRRRPAVIICPGGAYAVTSDREAEPVAIRLNSMGFQCFILRYTTPAPFPTALLQVMKAVATVRERAEEWFVDPGRVAVMGFSAGGHLAASLGCFSRADFCSRYGIDPEAVRPDGILLSYPVISSGPNRHQGSFVNLLGERYEELLDDVCLEKQVTDKTPPAFLWHTFDDEAVPVENSLLFASALREKGVPFELHIYPKGPHGLSLATEESRNREGNRMVEPRCEGWIELAGAWLRNL